jgi:hypothetical protein
MKKDISFEIMKNIDERESVTPKFIKKDYKNEEK